MYKVGDRVRLVSRKQMEELNPGANFLDDEPYEQEVILERCAEEEIPYPWSVSFNGKTLGLAYNENCFGPIIITTTRQKRQILKGY